MENASSKPPEAAILRTKTAEMLFDTSLAIAVVSQLAYTAAFIYTVAYTQYFEVPFFLVKLTKESILGFWVIIFALASPLTVVFKAVPEPSIPLFFSFSIYLLAVITWLACGVISVSEAVWLIGSAGILYVIYWAVKYGFPVQYQKNYEKFLAWARPTSSRVVLVTVALIVLFVIAWHIGRARAQNRVQFAVLHLTPAPRASIGTF